MRIFCIFVVSLFSKISADVEKNEQLLMVHVIWRHGDRAPVSIYPTDPNDESAWLNGFGELTPLGIRQQFELGRKLRQRYVGILLDPHFAFREVYIQSTDRNRTLMSAMINLAGMFPVPAVEVPNWPTGWQPIPVHVVPDNHKDNIFAPCQRADQLHQQVRETEKNVAIVEENREFFEFLTEKTGKLVDMSNIFDLHDTHWIEKMYDLPQPEWLTENVAERIRNLSEIDTRFDNGVGESYTPELIRLLGGRLLKQMIDRMQIKMDCFLATKNGRGQNCGWINDLKYHAFSAHDTTIYAVLATLGNPEHLMNMTFPPYCSTLAMELWLLDEVPNVRVLFDDTPITSKIDGCPNETPFCPLDTFTIRSTPFLPNDIENECLRVM